MTQAILLKTKEKEEQLKEEGKRRLNVSGVLRLERRSSCKHPK